MLLTIGDGKSEKMLHLLEIQKSKFKSQNCNLKLKTGKLDSRFRGNDRGCGNDTSLSFPA
jgi:hypothetical protein